MPDLSGEAQEALADGARGRRRRHWRRTRGLTGVLLLCWAAVSFVLPYHARTLDGLFLGWPFSFWVAAQGSLLVYLALVAVYAWAMARWDRQMDRRDDD